VGYEGEKEKGVLGGVWLSGALHPGVNVTRTEREAHGDGSGSTREMRKTQSL
jgi:hypothetical protein